MCVCLRTTLVLYIAIILCYHYALIGDDAVYFQLGMSMSLLIAVVIMAIVVIFMVTMYIYHKRGTHIIDT